MLKIDLHMHSAEDPRDALDYSARDLIRHAAGLDFDVIAVTLHGKVLDDPSLVEFAASRGVLFIAGIEKRIHGKEVLVLNVTQTEMDAVRSFDDLRELKLRRRGEVLVIAPHPFFKRSQCLGRHLEENIDLFDAIEYCHLYTRFWNLNRKAVAVAESHRKPLLATSDAHALWMASVFGAIRAGRVKPHAEAMSAFGVAYKLGWAMFYHEAKRIRRDWLGHGAPALAPLPAKDAASKANSPVA
jgi:predicted metal-dependent phosphoesterase TrpH